MSRFAWVQEVYDKWERESREDGARELFVHLVSHRFGEVPNHVAALIQSADHATLWQWATNLLTAQSLDDVLR